MHLRRFLIITQKWIGIANQSARMLKMVFPRYLESAAKHDGNS
jgi:hypothetical protein